MAWSVKSKPEKNLRGFRNKVFNFVVAGVSTHTSATQPIPRQDEACLSGKYWRAFRYENQIS